MKNRGRLVIALALTASAVLGLAVQRVPITPPIASQLPLAGAPEVQPENDSGWKLDTSRMPPGMTRLHRELPRYVSFTRGVDWKGDFTTAWRRASPKIALTVAGDPTAKGSRLEIEVRKRDGSTQIIPYPGPDSGGYWLAWQLDLPADAVELRMRGVDASAEGWVGFSIPGAIDWPLTFDLKMVLQTIGTAMLAVVLLLGPGLILCAARKCSFVDTIWPGPLALALGGLVAWGLGGVVAPAIVATVWCFVSLAVVVVIGWRMRLWERAWSPSELLVIALFPLCVLGAAAKAAFSGGPVGELYGGSISRTLEVGGHSDSRISFGNLQLVAHHLNPYEPEGEKYFLPWFYSSRGAFVGLITAPVVLATGARPPIEIPDFPWKPYDSEGFAAYRIVVIALGALALVAVAGTLRLVCDESRALLGVALFAPAPFFWHELYFTWPKLITAVWVIGAFATAVRGRFALAGLSLGAAYLQHPMALLSAPFLALWIFGARGDRLFDRLKNTAGFCAGVFAVIAAWQAINHGHNSQSGFLTYFLMSDGGDSTPTKWLSNRWDNFATTLFPLYVWLFKADHISYTAIGVQSDRWVQFFLQYWSTAPFGVGIVAWVFLIPAFVRGLIRHWFVGTCFLTLPFFFQVAYWGISPTGMLRLSGHAMFLGGWIFVVWAASEKIPRWLVRGPMLSLRMFELLAMMFLPALIGSRFQLNAAWVLNDIWWLAVEIACAIGFVWAVRWAFAQEEAGADAPVNFLAPPSPAPRATT